jgi:hypothetical protein
MPNQRTGDPSILRRKDHLDDNDVVGRGVLGSKNHPGNIKYRNLVKEKCQEYNRGTKAQKDAVVDEIKRACGEFVFKKKEDKNTTSDGGPWYVHNLTKRNDTIRNALNSKANEKERKQSRKRRRTQEPLLDQKPVDEQEETIPTLEASKQQPSSFLRVERNIEVPEASAFELLLRGYADQKRDIPRPSNFHSPLDILSFVSALEHTALLENRATVA